MSVQEIDPSLQNNESRGNEVASVGLTRCQSLETKTSALFVTIALHQAELGPQCREGLRRFSGGTTMSNIVCRISDGTTLKRELYILESSERGQLRDASVLTPLAICLQMQDLMFRAGQKQTAPGGTKSVIQSRRWEAFCLSRSFSKPLRPGLAGKRFRMVRRLTGWGN